MARFETFVYLFKTLKLWTGGAQHTKIRMYTGRFSYTAAYNA